MLHKEKRKRKLKWYEIWYLKAEKGCKRKNERGNEQVRKKSKNTVFSKTKDKYSWFFFFFKKRKPKSEIYQNMERKLNRRLRERKLCFLLFIAGVALNPSFSNCDAERSADHNDGETFTQKEKREVKVRGKSYQQ